MIPSASASLAVLALALAATGAFGAVGDSSPRAIALGRSYTALARGPEAAFWNPANLALRASPDFRWEMLAAGIGLVAENNAFSVKAYNDHFTDDEHILTDRDKQDLLAEVPGDGLRFNMDLMPSVIAGLPVNGGVAFPMPWGIHAAVTTGLAAGVEGELPKDIFDLMFYGNEFDRPYDVSDWDGSGWAVASLNWSGARPWLPPGMEPFLGELSFGLTLKLLGGGYGEIVETSGVLEVLPTGAELDELQGLAQFGGGIGFGIDLGVAGVTRDRRTTFGLSVLNLLDAMTWGIAAEQDSFYAAASGLRVTRLLDVEDLWDILDQADLNGDGVEELLEKVGEESFSRSLPALVRLGVSHRPMPRLTLLANYDQALSEGFGLTTTPRASLGAEYRLLPWFPARSGISLGGRGPSTGIGFSFGPFTIRRTELELLDFAYATRGGLVPGSSKGSALSLTFFRFSLIS